MGELKKRGDVWWIRYCRAGKRYEESSRSDKKKVALDLLRQREGDGAKGLAVTPKIGRLRFEEAAEDVLNDYRTNGKKSFDAVERRLRKHLTPFFGSHRMQNISTALVRAYVAHRQAQTTITRGAYTVTRKDGTVTEVPEQQRTIERVSNGEINRELTILKRVFSLAVQSGKLLHKPYVPLLREDNTRTGFFEPEQYASVQAHLPPALRPVIEFAYITGWRIDSEVLPLQWRQVDFRAGEIRLDAGTTKNREGRVFPMTDDLRALLEAQHAEHLSLKKAGEIFPFVFFRMVADSRGGQKHPKSILAFTKAWKVACIAAGCPGRVPHDLRRTAIRHMVRRGVSERVAMKLTGHKTPSIFQRYNIVSDGDLRAAAMQLAGLTGSDRASALSLAAAGRRPESHK
ncbi:MAG: tyrosine-type recombinase/integrase [Acidobacteriota bacterium]|nr:tyrosine-type recombinase/integrase [Acidobacteriota bacterium]